jgi:hypothetical protein
MRINPYNINARKRLAEKINHEMYIEFLELLHKRRNTLANAVNSLDSKKIDRILKSILVKIGLLVSRLTSTEFRIMRLEMELLIGSYPYDDGYRALQKVVILNKYYEFDTDDIPDRELLSFIDNTILLQVFLSLKKTFEALPLCNVNTKRNGKNTNNSNTSNATFNKNINLHKMTNVQRATMWTSNSYQRIQNARRNLSASPNIGNILINQGITTVMTKMAYKAPYMPRGIGKKPKYLYRGVHGSFVLQLLLSGVFEEKGYIPFTRNPYIAEHFATSQISPLWNPIPYAILKLNVKNISRNTPWIWFDSCLRSGNQVPSLCSSEQEVLLPPGTMRIKNFKRGLETGVWEIDFKPDRKATNLRKKIQIFGHMKPHHPMITRRKSILQTIM